MKTYPIALIAATAAVIAAPAGAQDTPPPAPAQPAFQVVRLGDTQLSCEALITEINDLNGQTQAAQTAMTARTTELTRTAMRGARGGGMRQGALLSLGSLAASFVPGGALVASAAQTLTSAAAQAAAQSEQDRMIAQMDDATAGLTADMNAMVPIGERVAHLTEISRDKGC